MNLNHDGSKGHWLEKQMGIKPNASNAPDLLGFEMKNQTTSKTTFGDWSPNYFIFNDEENYSKGKRYHCCTTQEYSFSSCLGSTKYRDNRLSWSGKPIPKIDQWNDFGCILLVNPNNDIEIIYNIKEILDLTRAIVPEIYRNGSIVIARWDAIKLAKKVNDKFNQKGWFTCKTDHLGVYNQICFGDPITFEVDLFSQDRSSFYDSGMYETNPRPYAQWRANNSYWNSLIVEHP